MNFHNLFLLRKQNYIKNIKYNKTKGTVMKSPSNLSNIPPCPGSKFPESLWFRLLFSIDSDKSPRILKTIIISAIIIHCNKLNSI